MSIGILSGDTPRNSGNLAKEGKRVSVDIKNETVNVPTGLFDDIIVVDSIHEDDTCSEESCEKVSVKK